VIKNQRGLACMSVLLTMAISLACSLVSLPGDSSALEPVSVKNAGTVIVLSEGDGVREDFLSNLESQLAWSQKLDMFPVNGRWSTWLAQFTLAPDEEPVAPHGFYRLSPQQPSYGRLLVSNIFYTPHSLRLVFFLDYQPLLVQTKSGLQETYYMPEMPVGAEQAVELRFPPLPKGLHHLSILLITDPESESVDLEYRGNQQRSCSEQRYDLWVGIEELPSDVPAFPNREQAVSGGGFRAVFDVVKSAPPPYALIEELDLDPGTEHELGLLFAAEEQSSNSPPYTGTLPLRIGVFWNDRLYAASEYELDPRQKLSEPMLLPYSITAPTEPGHYQMQIVIWLFPWHALHSADGDWISFGKVSFSRRILVTVADR